MAPSNERYSVSWAQHANNFSDSFYDLLEQKQLVDVTLAADGHLFPAHRLVLSALSPYFHGMFAEMPVQQQAIGNLFFSFLYTYLFINETSPAI